MNNYFRLYNILFAQGFILIVVSSLSKLFLFSFCFCSVFTFFFINVCVVNYSEDNSNINSNQCVHCVNKKTNTFVDCIHTQTSKKKNGCVEIFRASILGLMDVKRRHWWLCRLVVISSICVKLTVIVHESCIFLTCTKRNRIYCKVNRIHFTFYTHGQMTELKDKWGCKRVVQLNCNLKEEFIHLSHEWEFYVCCGGGGGRLWDTIVEFWGYCKNVVEHSLFWVYLCVFIVKWRLARVRYHTHNCIHMRWSVWLNSRHFHANLRAVDDFESKKKQTNRKHGTSQQYESNLKSCDHENQMKFMEQEQEQKPTTNHQQYRSTDKQ